MGTPVPTQIHLGGLAAAGDVQLSELTGVLGWGSRHVDGEAVAHQGVAHSLEYAAWAACLGGEQIHVLGRPGQQAVSDRALPPASANPCPAAACEGQLRDANLERIGVRGWSAGGRGDRAPARARSGCWAC